MRLIDADELEEKITKWLKPSKPDEDELISIPDALVSTMMTIDEQPTAYDVDKVVEELEEIIYPQRLYFCRVSKGGCNKSDDVGCIDCAIQKAIEIVKRGGKNE